MSERASTKGRDDELASASIRPELISRVESGDGRDRALDRDVWVAVGWAYEKRGKDRREWLYAPAGIRWDGYRQDHPDPVGWSIARMDVTDSLDAVVSLIEQNLPNANCHGYDLMPKEVVGYVSRNCIPAGERAWMHEGYAKTPARALLAAFLRAIQAQARTLADAHSKNPPEA